MKTEAEVLKSNAYRDMMNSWAWKDFEKFLEETRISSLESAVVCDEVKDIQLWRGYVKCLDSIKSHLGYVLG